MATFPCSAPRTKTTANQSNLWISRMPKPDTTEAWPRPLTSHWHHGSVVTSRLNQSSSSGWEWVELWVLRDDVITEAFIFLLVWFSLCHFLSCYCTTLITEYLYSITALFCLYVHVLCIQFIYLLPSFFSSVLTYIAPFVTLLSSLMSFVPFCISSFPSLPPSVMSLWCLIKRVNEAGGISWAIVSVDVLISDWSLQGQYKFKRKIREKRGGGWFIKSHSCVSLPAAWTHHDNNKISLHI